MTSIGRIIVAPTPTQAPLTAAIRGFEERTRPIQSPPPRSCAPPDSIRDLKLSRMSAPAQNPRPAPVTTMAPTSGASFRALIAACSSRLISFVQAFSRSGRFRVMTAMSSPFSTRIVLNSTVSTPCLPAAPQPSS